MEISFLFLLLAVGFLFTNYVNEYLVLPPLSVKSEESKLKISDKISYFNFGHRRLMLALLWIKTLLDADIEHYQKRDLGNWLYLRFRALLELDPLFLEAYQYGGLYLSVIKDDIKGATEIYNLGLAKFPNDDVLNFNAGIHFLKEEKDLARALLLLQRVVNAELCPPHIPLLIARIMLKLGKPKDEVIRYLEELLKISNNEFRSNNIQKKIHELKKN